MRVFRRSRGSGGDRREQRRDAISARLGRGGEDGRTDPKRPAGASKETTSPRPQKAAGDKPKAAAGKRRQAAGAGLKSARRASARGLKATGAQLGPRLGKTRRRASAAARGAGPRTDWLITLVPRALLWAGRRLAALAALLAAGATRLSQLITPERGLVGVIACSAACLGVAQFVTFRGVEVGEPGYAGLAGAAPAPQTDHLDTGAAHAYLLLPLAVLAVLLAVVTVRSGRWRLGRLVSLAGLVGIAVSLAIDMPRGLDTGSAGVAFTGAHATLTGGFYVQLAASGVLVICGLLLSWNVRRSAGAGGRKRSRPQRRRSRGGTALAGGKA
jgi:hypothetical protein